MADQCCGGGNGEQPTDACQIAAACPTSACGGSGEATTPCAWFDRMIPNCLEYAKKAKSQGRPIVGILCEYTPRELIMAAGGVPVCLCGGSADTIAAAESQLPANLCPLIKSTFGYHVQGSNPFLEMADLIVGETTCDGKKKMFELMAETRPVYVIELPQKVDDEDAQRRIGPPNCVSSSAFLEDRFGVEICDEKIREAMRRDESRTGPATRAGRDDGRRQSAPCRAANCSSSRAASPACAPTSKQYEKDIGNHAFETTETAFAGSRVEQATCDDDGRAHGSRSGTRARYRGRLPVGLVVAMENCTGLKPIHGTTSMPTASDPHRRLGRDIFSSALFGDDAQRPEVRFALGQLAQDLPPRVRHRVDLAGMHHLRRGIQSGQALCRRDLEAFPICESRPTIRHPTPRESPCVSRRFSKPCARPDK